MKQLHDEADFDEALASGHALLITDSAGPGRIHSSSRPAAGMGEAAVCGSRRPSCG